MPGLNLYLTPGSAPETAPLPGTVQALLTTVSAYMGIAGAQAFNGVNFGSSTPSADNRALPWFKTDGSGNPLGWYSWNGTNWVGMPTVDASGPTASYPQNPSIGTKFYDTTIGAEVLYNGNQWTTASGTVGDVKFVQAPTIAQALVNNPGWIEDTASTGCVIGHAGAATAISAAHPYGSVIGEEAHTLLVTEIAAHTHTYPQAGGTASANGNTGPGGILSDANPGVTSSVGGSQPHNNIQPTIYYFALVKNQ